MIQQTINFFPNKFNPLPTKFLKRFWYNSDGNNILSAISDAYFDLQCKCSLE